MAPSRQQPKKEHTNDPWIKIERLRSQLAEKENQLEQTMSEIEFLRSEIAKLHIRSF